jgi:exonuclease VII large subunit
MSRWMGSIVAAVVAAAVAVQAHHSISSVYDGSRRVTIEGTVSEFQLINPHPFLFLDVTDAKGQAQQWRLEMDNRFELVAIGVTASTFKPGDKVVVTGSLARSQPHGMYVWRLDRPSDGFWYEQVGSSPRIANRR